jgi:U32 family peptidase
MNHSTSVLPELLAPAGGREQLEAAITYGADAVYMGGRALSLRAQCEGFDNEALASAVQYAHAAGVKVYYCLNALPYDKHLNAVCAQLERLPALGVDGLIAADPGVIYLARRYCPEVELHLSTQAHSVNAAAVSFWQEQGAKRINVARELSQVAMRRLIRAFPAMEFEIFVHGAQCLALSGHCLLSAWVNKRPANQGLCTQPCRFHYKGVQLTVAEERRGEEPFWDVQQGDDFSGIWAPTDLCLVRAMPWLARSGAAALKLEGRTKSGSYVAQIVDVYRTALLAQGQRLGLAPRHGAATAICQPSGDACVAELMHTASRPLSSGFFFPQRRTENKVPEAARPVVARLDAPAGEGWQVQVRGLWDAKRDAALLLPGMRRPVLRAGSYSLENHRGEKVDVLHSGTRGTLYWQGEGLASGLYIRA